mgnify:FL=1
MITVSWGCVVAVVAVTLTLGACGRKSEVPVVMPPQVPPVAANPAPVRRPPASVPEGARRWRKVILAEWRYAFGIASDEAIPFSQIAQESGWKEDARSRVGALGLSQFMPSTAAGFQRNVSRLQELCSTPAGCPMDPRWAIRAMTVYDFDEWKWAGFAPTDRDRWAFMLSSYNGGRAALRREQHACGKPCDQTRWFDHVERVGRRADWAIRENREYVRRIIFHHQPIYRRWLG